MKQDEPLYVSAGDTGGVVSRFGLQQVYIGAKRDPKEPNRLIFDKAEVVMIPPGEASRYRREYAKAIAAGDIVARKKEDFDAWQIESKRRDDEAMAAQKAAVAESPPVEALAKPPLKMREETAPKKATEKGGS